MLKSLRYVLKENFSNIYRIYCITRYELLADMRDSKLGLFWNFAHPLIQILTYWFAFGVVFNRKAITNYGVETPYILWMMGGMVVWFSFHLVLRMVAMPFSLKLMSLPK